MKKTYQSRWRVEIRPAAKTPFENHDECALSKDLAIENVCRMLARAAARRYLARQAQSLEDLTQLPGSQAQSQVA